MRSHAGLSRRGLLQVTAAVGGLAALGVRPAAAARSLVAAAAEARLVGAGYPATEVWAYGGTVPGPLLRLARGATAEINFENRLPVASTVHWHGLRIENAMDGVAGLTQDPVAPGRDFAYRFVPPDSGTYWYHSHLNGQEQVARGLSGPLIVAEDDPPQVDRELVWLLDDWRLNAQAQIVGGFENRHDLSHAGRLGNSVTVNGEIIDHLAVRAGERLRLRLINAANARIFALDFAGHRPWIVAVDGQGCRPHEPEAGRVVLGPAMRIDVILDMTGRPGERYEVIDDHYRAQAYRFVDLIYDAGPPLRESALDAPIRVTANSIPEPIVEDAQSHRVTLEGGAMGGMSAMTLDGQRLEARALAERGLFWGLNGVAGAGFERPGRTREPLLQFQPGRTQHIILRNETVFDHPMHLHGHHMKLLARDGRPESRGIWHDTVLVRPRETVELAFVADNPGDWLFHCHVLEHMKAGMAAVARVAA